MSSDFRWSDFVYRSEQRLVEGSTITSGSSRERLPPIKIAEIPRPLWHQPLIWDDDDPPPLPPRFDNVVAPRTRGEPPFAITIALIGALAAGAVVCFSVLTWTAQSKIADGTKFGAQTEETDLSSRIDTAMANLPREDLSGGEQKRALIRSARPELMSHEVDGAALDR
jgi:hypothetical protein